MSQNHRQLVCMFNRLFGLTKGISKLNFTGLLWPGDRSNIVSQPLLCYYYNNYLCPQLFARIICRALAHIVWRKVRRLASIQSPIWNTYSTETREAKLRQCLSPTVLLFDMWRESHIFNKIVTTHNHTSEESVVVIYNLTWFSMSIMVSQCLSWSI